MSKLKSLSFTILCISGLLVAGPVGATNADTGLVTITSIQVTTSSAAGQIFFTISTPWPNVDGCTNSTYAVVQVGARNFAQIEAMLYDAYANGDQVDFIVNGCNAIGTPTYPQIFSFTLQKTH